MEMLYSAYIRSYVRVSGSGVALRDMIQISGYLLLDVQIVHYHHPDSHSLGFWKYSKKATLRQPRIYPRHVSAGELPLISITIYDPLVSLLSSQIVNHSNKPSLYAKTASQLLREPSQRPQRHQ